jgi:putative membrane protein
LLPQVFANGDGDDEHHGMMEDMMSGMWGGGIWMGLLILMGLVFLGLVFLAAIYFFVMQSRRTMELYQKDVLQLARERLARGEITTEEFDEVKKRLQ